MVKPKNMLRKKLYRDMSRAAMQFLSIIALCALGTFAFSALDGMARMIRTTLNTYYEENNLADFWITLPTADRASMEKLAALPDVEAVCARASVDLDTTLPGDVSVSVTVYDGEMTINKPLLREGAPVVCLIKPQFEAGRDRVGKKGVVRDAQVHLDVVKEILQFIDADMGWTAQNLSFSPIKGPEGNIEFLVHILPKCRATHCVTEQEAAEVVRQAHESLGNA